MTFHYRIFVFDKISKGMLVTIEKAHHLEQLESVTKILSLEMIIFSSKMMVKSGPA
jgi:hypothetical protein